MITFSQFQEKIFDGKFTSKSIQDESLEVLQNLGKIVDSRKVYEHRITLRTGVFVLIKRPMTAVGEGYVIVQVIEDGGSDSLSPMEVESKVIRAYGGNDFKTGDTIRISLVDAMGVSEDNKRFYVVYPRPKEDEIISPEPEKKTNGGEKDNPDELLKKLAQVKESKFKNSKNRQVYENVISEKYLNRDEIQDLIDSIKDKLEGRRDSDSKGMLKLTKDIEKTFKKNNGRLHPNSVVAIQRISTGVSGDWGKNSPDWTGKSPSGRLNKFPPSPTNYIRGVR